MPKIIDDAAVYRATIEVFTRNGYDNATTLQIAKTAGINEATLFRKYRNKASLLCAALSYLLADTPMSRLEYSGNLRADLFAIITAYMETNAVFGPVFPIIMTEIPRHPELRGGLDVPMKTFANIAGLLERYQKSGQLRVEPPLIALTDLLAPLMVRQTFGRAMGKPIPTDIAAHVEYYMNGKATPDRNAS